MRAADVGLLVARLAGLLLAATFGIAKLAWYWNGIHAGTAVTSIGLVHLIDRMGFPLPFLLAVWITLNESIGALLIACGLFTRAAAASVALGMLGAMYTSIRLDEDWQRAALYALVFAAVSLLGPGRYSIDELRRRRLTHP